MGFQKDAEPAPADTLPLASSLTLINDLTSTSHTEDLCRGAFRAPVFCVDNWFVQ